MSNVGNHHLSHHFKMSNQQLTSQVYTAVLKKWNNVKSRRYNHEENRFKVIAAFVTTDQYGGNVQVLSIGTGSKCASDEEQLANKFGQVVYDSHAEVVARRALIRLLYEHLEKARCAEYHSVLERTSSGKYRLKQSKRLYLFVSSPPCGAASLEEGVKDCDVLRVIQEASHAPKPKMTKSSSGDELSYSCSDKITMWNMVGVQGSLLSTFIDPIFVDGVIIAEAGTNTTRVKKALYGRVRNNRVPQFEVLCGNRQLASLYRDFTGTSEPRSTAAAPITHNWYLTRTSGIELINSKEGNIYGLNRQSKSRICKMQFYIQFIQWARRQTIFPNIYKSNSTYRESKNQAVYYQKMKRAAEEKFTDLGLGVWVYQSSIHFENFK